MPRLRTVPEELQLHRKAASATSRAVRCGPRSRGTIVTLDGPIITDCHVVLWDLTVHSATASADDSGAASASEGRIDT